jgi:uncharacterized protein with PQ loop repeat
MIDAIGWLSSLILLATVISQVRKQWRDRSGQSVSPWLFVGQTAASLGFTTYSVLVHNWVFTVTNGLLLLSGVAGCLITNHFRKPQPSAAEARHAALWRRRGKPPQGARARPVHDGAE